MTSLGILLILLALVAAIIIIAVLKFLKLPQLLEYLSFDFSAINPFLTFTHMVIAISIAIVSAIRLIILFLRKTSRRRFSPTWYGAIILLVVSALILKCFTGDVTDMESLTTAPGPLFSEILLAENGQEADAHQILLQSGVESTPVRLADGTIVVGTQEGRVIGCRDGNMRWQFPAENSLPLSGSVEGIAASGSTIYFSHLSLEAKVYAVEVKDDTPVLKWSMETNCRSLCDPIIARGGTCVLFALEQHDDDVHDGLAILFNAFTGDVLWNHCFGSSFWLSGSPVELPDGSFLFVGGGKNKDDLKPGRVARLNHKGELMWCMGFDESRMYRSLVVAPGNRLIWNKLNGNVECFTYSDYGIQFEWRKKLSGQIYSSPALSYNGENVYIPTTYGMLYCLSIITGEIITEQRVGYSVCLTPTLDKYDNVYVPAPVGVLMFNSDLLPVGSFQFHYNEKITGSRILLNDGIIHVGTSFEDLEAGSIWSISRLKRIEDTSRKITVAAK